MEHTSHEETRSLVPLLTFKDITQNCRTSGQHLNLLTGSLLKEKEYSGDSKQTRFVTRLGYVGYTLSNMLLHVNSARIHVPSYI